MTVPASHRESTVVPTKRNRPSSKESGAVRPFVRTDIPAVAALRRLSFRDSERQAPMELESYIERIFFDPAPQAGVLPSVVYERDGVVTGFLGVIPRTMLLRGRPVRVAIATQLMSAPHNPGSAGRQLLRAVFDGPQDLTMSDSGNDASLGLNKSLGGRAFIPYSLSWILVVRPARVLLAQHAGGTMGRTLSRLLKPACSAIDAVRCRAAMRRAPRMATGDRIEVMQMHLQLSELDALFDRWALRPLYDRESLGWLLERLREKRGCGDLQQCLVRDARGKTAGWFMYGRDHDGTGQVVQLVARKGAEDGVIAHLMDHAWTNGTLSLTGRLAPELMGPLARAGCAFAHHGSWMLVNSRHEEVLTAVERCDAFLSRLEGEWWLSY